ncbi:MAG: glutathione S-transferase family protein [Pseudomonadota bacterium]
MRTLLHTPLDPACRTVRIALAEKGLTVRLERAIADDPDGDVAALNPARTLPVLIDEAPDGAEIALSPTTAILEYLEEAHPTPALAPAGAAARAETRRLVWWFLDKYEREVNAATLRPRLEQNGLARVSPARSAACAEALAWHLDYLSWLLETRDGLAGPDFTLADIAGAAHLSTSDYLDLVPWSQVQHVKRWYQRLKSRPSFRSLLADRIDGPAPPPHYADLDF